MERTTKMGSCLAALMLWACNIESQYGDLGTRPVDSASTDGGVSAPDLAPAPADLAGLCGDPVKLAAYPRCAAASDQWSCTAAEVGTQDPHYSFLAAATQTRPASQQLKTKSGWHKTCGVVDCLRVLQTRSSSVTVADSTQRGRLWRARSVCERTTACVGRDKQLGLPKYVTHKEFTYGGFQVRNA